MIFQHSTGLVIFLPRVSFKTIRFLPGVSFKTISGKASTLDLDSETDLKLPKPKTNFLKRSFQYSASTLWNDLSTEAKKATNLNEFKRLISNVPFVEAV